MGVEAFMSAMLTNSGWATYAIVAADLRDTLHIKFKAVSIVRSVVPTASFP